MKKKYGLKNYKILFNYIMGNIPLHFNCLCPQKEDDILNEINEMKSSLKLIEFKEIPNMDKRINMIEENQKNLTKLENKLDRLEDKIEMRFELLFLNMKIKNNNNSNNNTDF